MASFEHTPAVAAYLPSEVARLVLGYLKDENCMKTCEMFLAECHHLKEYSTLLKQGLTYPLHVDGKSLVTILDEYRSMAQEEFDLQRPGWLKQLWRKHDIMINQLKLVHGLPYSSIHSGRHHGAGLQRPLRRLEASNPSAAVGQGAVLSSANSVMNITAKSALVDSRKQGIHRQSSRELATVSVAQSPAYPVARSLACTTATVIGRSVPSGTKSPINTEMCNTSMPTDVASASPETQVCIRNSPVPRLFPPVTVRSPAAIAVQPATAQTLFPVSTTVVDACSAAPNVTVSLAVSQPVYVTSSLSTAVTTSSTTTVGASSISVRTSLHSSFATQREYDETNDIGVDVEPHTICDQSTLHETMHLTAVREIPACAGIASTGCPEAVSMYTNNIVPAASVPPGSVAATVDVTTGSPRRKRSSTDRKKRMTPGKNLRSPGKEDTIENLSGLFPMPCLVETLLKATNWHEHLAENINRHLTRKSTEKSSDEAQNCANETANPAATAADDHVIRFEESETEAAIREVLALTRDDPTFNDFHALIDNVYTDLPQDPPDHTSAPILYDSTICYSDVEVIRCDSVKVSQRATSSARDQTQGEPSPNVATTQPPMLDHYQSRQPWQWPHNGKQQGESAPSVDTRLICATTAAAATTAPVATHSVALGRIPCTGDAAANTTPAVCVISVPEASANTLLPSGIVVGERRSPTASVNSPHAAIARCEGTSGRSTPPLTLYPMMISATAKYAQKATGSATGGSRCSSRVASPTQLHSGETVESATTGSATGASKSADLIGSMAASNGTIAVSAGSMAASGDSMAASGGSMADSGASMADSAGSMTASGGVFVNLAPHPIESGTTMYVVISNGNKVDKQVVTRGRPRVDPQVPRHPVKQMKPLRPANSAAFGCTVKPAVVPAASPIKLAVKPAQRGSKKSQKKKVIVQSSAVSSEAAGMAQRKLTNALNAKASSHKSGNHVRVLTFSPSRPEATVAARSSSGSNSNIAAVSERCLRGRHSAASRHRQPVPSRAHSLPPPAAATATEAASVAPEDAVPELVGQVIHVVEQQDDHRVLLGSAGDFVIMRCDTADFGGGTSSATSSDDDLFRHFTIVDNASEPASSGPPPAATTASVSCSSDCVQRVATNDSPAAAPGQPVAATGIGHAYALKKRLVNKRTMSDRLAAERKDAKKRKLKSYNINNLLSKIHQ